MKLKFLITIIFLGILFFLNIQQVFALSDSVVEHDSGDSSGDCDAIYGCGGLTGGGCFLSQTQILLPDQTTKSIEDIKVGEDVLSKNPKNGKITASKVIKTFQHEGIEATNEYLIITTDNNKRLNITSNHPVLLKKSSFLNLQFLENTSTKWQEIGKARIGDQLWDISDGWVEITTIKNIKETVPVYNLEVENTHTYFADGLLVHNKIDKEGEGGGGGGTYTGLGSVYSTTRITAPYIDLYPYNVIGDNSGGDDDYICEGTDCSPSKINAMVFTTTINTREALNGENTPNCEDEDFEIVEIKTNYNSSDDFTAFHRGNESGWEGSGRNCVDYGNVYGEVTTVDGHFFSPSFYTIGNNITMRYAQVYSSNG
ncbi:MAG: hypothetical protein GYA14_03715, partial [Ignavibacteria bacterium]|nr:hypothetical protein [Ignavibacteria bacterium]